MPDGVDEAAAALAKAMQDAVAQGELTVESDAGKVVVRLPSGTGPEAAQQIADAISEAATMAAAQADGGPTEGDAGGTAATDTASTTGGGSDGGANNGEALGGDTEQFATGNGTEGTTGGAGVGNGKGIIRAKLAALQAGLLLEAQIAEGSVDIEQRDGAIVVTVGAGGAFASGSADITPEAQDIIANLQEVAGKATKISVTGHTDNVPLSGSTYADNWDLASARAATVLREISDSGLVPDAELVAQSRGETQPVADNSTPEGREKNRRIEIEIEFNEMEE
jgi:chemotaxis protein MotB